MALTGLQIFKYLPGGKKDPEANCKKCGFPTCMVFAMNLAKGQTDVSKCEFISDELKALIEETSRPKQIEILWGNKDTPIKTGGETVIFRHEKTFINPSVIAISLDSDDEKFEEKLLEIKSYETERVGDIFKINVLEIVDKGDFLEKVKIAYKEGFALILRSNDIKNLKEALETLKDSTPLIFPQDASYNELKDVSVPIVISAKNIDDLKSKSSSLQKEGFKEIVLNIDSKSPFEDLTKIRIESISEGEADFGYPSITYIKSDNDILIQTILASTMICKYSNIIVLEDFNPALLSVIFTLRQNIYTDPQKPLQVDAGLYKIGEPDGDAPLFVTTNFALTYFSVLNELETTGKSAYLLITPSDGMSVLTAWSASKFTGEIIAKALKNADMENILNHRNVIIPGLAASLREELKYEIPDWNVIVGTDEAISIPEFLKTLVLS